MKHLISDELIIQMVLSINKPLINGAVIYKMH